MKVLRGSRLWGLALVLFGCVSACSPSAALRGGSVVARGSEPSGVVLARYRAGGCVDAAGQVTPASRGDVWVVRGDDGVTRLVEAIGGYDSLVVENSFATPTEWVFQLSTNSLPEPFFIGGAGVRDDLLLDYRLPRDGCGEGRLGLVRSWREARLEGGAVRAHFERSTMTCRLEPTRPELGGASRAAAHVGRGVQRP